MKIMDVFIIIIFPSKLRYLSNSVRLTFQLTNIDCYLSDPLILLDQQLAKKLMEFLYLASKH